MAILKLQSPPGFNELPGVYRRKGGPSVKLGDVTLSLFIQPGDVESS